MRVDFSYLCRLNRRSTGLQYEYRVDITGRNLELAEMRPQIVSGVDDVTNF